MSDVHFVSSPMDMNLTFEDAMKWEEDGVEKFACEPNGLNMIPGGSKGLKFLHKHRITDRAGISLDGRDSSISDYHLQNSRKNIPNPFMAGLWEVGALNDDSPIRY
ncbi:MAG: hypothetical protein HKN84_03895 [Gammaproteobacteria bacterium]|nr:hypothetical protein [Gammaproteobacteria bacterium]